MKLGIVGIRRHKISPIQALTNNMAHLIKPNWIRLVTTDMYLNYVEFVPVKEITNEDSSWNVFKF